MSLTRPQIQSAFKSAGTDKSNLHGYDLMYSRVFEQYPNITKLLEIGIFKGQSLVAWRELFPEAEIVGVDRKIRTDIVEAAMSIKMIEADSARTSIREKVGEGYNIIIDDGDHRPDWQWQTFLNLKDCWTDCYVIEDVIGLENEQLLRRRLDSQGYFKVDTFASKKSNALMRIKGEDVRVPFYSMVIHANK